MNENRPERILAERFGYGAFRMGQSEVIDAVVSGRDCIAVMPTGAGKSICYQVPAVAAHDDDPRAIVLVISPLVSLMSDQVESLNMMGVPAAYINAKLVPRQQREVMERAARGAYALMYVAPERLGDPRFREFASCGAGGSADGSRVRIPLIAIDEAHCVSQWGQDFRPSYLVIADFIEQLPSRPVVAAFTATATPRVAEDIVRLLHLENPLRVATGFDRPNLRFEVEQATARGKLERVVSIISENPGESGVVYCSTRKDAEKTCADLVEAGIDAVCYHAGLPHDRREESQRKFVHDDASVIVATNAFGMGIDKSNVRFVVHYNMPASLEAYYQEAGRAGRDGEPARCLLLWNDADIATCRFFIEQDVENEELDPQDRELVRASHRRRLASMVSYCMTAECLRASILRYFGDVAPQECGNCSNCAGGSEAVDVTKTARSIMRCVHELRGRYGKGIVADVVCGSQSAKVFEYGLDKSRTYGVVDDPAVVVKDIIELLCAGGYLEISEGRYPLVGLGPNARAAATDKFRLFMKRRTRRQKASAGLPASHVVSDSANVDPDLFERLRALRKKLADDAGVPPYVVFSDASLRHMCAVRPQTNEQFATINGVGPAKLKRYAKPFLEELAR